MTSLPLRCRTALALMLGLTTPACSIGVATDGWSASVAVGLLGFFIANLLYLLWRREDHPGEIRRSVAFLAGFPLTFLTFLLVEPDPQRSWRGFRRRESLDDPELVEADFQRELARIRRLRRKDPPGTGGSGEE